MDLLNDDDRFDKLIVDSFLDFVNSLNLFDDNGSTSSMLLEDDSIRSYIQNAIKQFYEEYENHHVWLANSDDDKFDLADIEIDSFIEIIDAYFSGFRDLKHDDIFNWLRRLRKQALDESKKKPVESTTKTNQSDKDPANNADDDEKINDTKSLKQSKVLDIEKLKSEDPNVNLLIEMFPDLSVEKIVSSYKKANRSYDKTIDDLLILANSYQDDSDLSESERKLLKEKTVQKFGLVSEPVDSTAVNYKPITKWEAEKKLIRYYENKVVTTKGEKYFEPKTEEDEEKAKEMKKTFINLKPARKLSGFD